MAEPVLTARKILVSSNAAVVGKKLSNHKTRFKNYNGVSFWRESLSEGAGKRLHTGQR
jgi:hypothetical protein